MNTTSAHLADLISKHLRGQLNEHEAQELHLWLEQSIENKEFFQRIAEPKYLFKNVSDRAIVHKEIFEKVRQLIEADYQESTPTVITNKLRWLKITVAAAVILFIGAGVIWYMDHKKLNKSIPTITQINDVEPGQVQPRLILTDGRVLSIDSINSGSSISEGGVKILKLKDGSLSYLLDEHSTIPGSKAVFNTVTVPRGSNIINLTLSDGSKVWLNVGSSIRYPISFKHEKDRVVELSGEAYFEVTHKKNNPFKVKGEDILVEVLGTKFDVSDYKDEVTKTATLIEGAVNITTQTSGQIKKYTLKPGQQAKLGASAIGKIHISNGIETDQVLAWKNGKFYFEDDDIQSIMRQIGRWYDVEIVYNDNIERQSIHLNGEISRYSNVSKVLDMLETTGRLKFKLDGRKVIVTAR